MQYHDASKNPRRYKVQFVDLLKVAPAAFTYKITPEDKKKLSKEQQLSKQKEKEDEMKMQLVDYLKKSSYIRKTKITYSIPIIFGKFHLVN